MKDNLNCSFESVCFKKDFCCVTFVTSLALTGEKGQQKFKSLIWFVVGRGTDNQLLALLSLIAVL